MNTPSNLGDLLHDAVDGIEPADRIEEIRARTASDQRSAARPWFYAAGGVVLATAATVAAFALLGDDSTPDSSHHDHHVASDPPTTQTQVVPAYFVGDSPDGPRLYREYDTVPAGDPLQAALDRIQQPPADPDYRSLWPEGSFGDVTIDDDSIDVERNVNAPIDELAVQQLVYTLQGAAGERLPVYLWLEGQRGNAPYTAAPELDVLNLVSISDPAQGNTYSGTFTARGRASSYEGNVPWEIRRIEDDEVVLSGYATALGWMDRLYKWETEVDLTGIEPGTYTFVAMTDDPSGGTEGFGPFVDTRTIVVR